MPDARLAGPGDLAFVQDTTLAAYSAYLPVLGALPLPVDADHAADIAQGQVWLVRDGDADAGLMMLVAGPDHLMIESLAVLPACQGRGLGRWMLGFAERLARQAGLPEAAALHQRADDAEHRHLRAGRVHGDGSRSHPAPRRLHPGLYGQAAVLNRRRSRRPSSPAPHRTGSAAALRPATPSGCGRRCLG